MNKYIAVFLKTFLFLSVIYIWPSCDKKDNEPTPPGSDSTGTPRDTTKDPNDTVILKGWVVSTFAGVNNVGYVDGPANQARFSLPNCMTIDQQGNLCVSESGNKAIRLISTTTGQVSTLVKEDSSKGLYIGRIDYLVSDGMGTFFAPYPLSPYVRKITATTSIIIAGGLASGSNDGQGTAASFYHISSIARDSKGNLYIPQPAVSGNTFTIRKIDPAGLVSTLLLKDNTGITQVTTAGVYPIAADSSGNLYVAVNKGSLIKKIDPQGNVSLLAGSTTTGFLDGKGAAARFNNIVEVQVDNAGNVWVCDTQNHAIRRIAPDGTVTTIAGNGTPGYKNGNPPKAQFNYPLALAIDKNGDVYTLEGYNNVVRRIKYYN